MNKDLVKMGCILSVLLCGTLVGSCTARENTEPKEEIIIEPTPTEEPILNPEDYEQNIEEIDTDPTVEGTWDIFTITYYCGCNICNGDYGSVDAYGEPLTIGTVACNVLPLGTVIDIGGVEYVVRDRLSSIYDGENRIDIYVEDHEEALENGIEYGVEVFIKGY